MNFWHLSATDNTVLQLVSADIDNLCVAMRNGDVESSPALLRQ